MTRLSRPHSLAQNHAYTVLSDETQRRMYDLQRPDTPGRAAIPNPFSFVRLLLLGRNGRAVGGWGSDVIEMGAWNAARLQRSAAHRGSPMLVMYTLGRGTSCSRARAMLRGAASRLRGAASVAHVDMEAEAALARASRIDDVPTAVLIVGSGARRLGAEEMANADRRDLPTPAIPHSKFDRPALSRRANTLQQADRCSGGRTPRAKRGAQTFENRRRTPLTLAANAS